MRRGLATVAFLAAIAATSALAGNDEDIIRSGINTLSGAHGVGPSTPPSSSVILTRDTGTKSTITGREFGDHEPSGPSNPISAPAK